MIEVERRTNFMFDMPDDARLIGVGRIHDTYRTISLHIERVRQVTSNGSTKLLRTYKYCSGIGLTENETEISQDEYDGFIKGIRDPIVVSGNRKQYSVEREPFTGLIICDDEIDQLGHWREIEALAADRMNVNYWMHKINKAAQSLGIPWNKLTKTLYVEMVAKLPSASLSCPGNMALYQHLA